MIGSYDSVKLVVNSKTTLILITKPISYCISVAATSSCGTSYLSYPTHNSLLTPVKILPFIGNVT